MENPFINKSYCQVNRARGWKRMGRANDYKIMNLTGFGHSGTVMKAKCLKTGKEYAIKLIETPFIDKYRAKRTLREI